jgi:hypothetical protein
MQRKKTTTRIPHVRRRRHAPGAAGGTKATPLTGEGHELLMGAVGALQEGIELLFDKIGQARPSLKFDLGQEGSEVFLEQLVEDGIFGTPPLIVDAPSCRRRLHRVVNGP